MLTLKSLVARLYGRLPVIRELHALHAQSRLLANHLAGISETLAMISDPRHQDDRRLLRHYAQVCSQNGEDGMIHEIFRRIGVTDRVFVELGVGDGRENNTAFLLSCGWSGFWIDGDDRFTAVMERPDIAGSLRGRSAFITKENVGALLADLGVPRSFDLLCIDIDMNTYHVWDALRDYTPRVVVVEYNAAIPPDIDWKVRYAANRMWDGSQNFGASLKAFELLGRDLGYSLVGCDLLGVNAFFVRDSLLNDMFAPPYTSQNHYHPPRYALVARKSHPGAVLDRQ